MLKKILLWTSSYPPILGGLQTLVSQLAEGLAINGYEVLVLTNRYPLNLKAKEIINGVNIRRILHSKEEMNGLKGFVNKFIFPIQRRKITSAIKTFSPDVINIHFPDSQLPYIKAVKGTLPKTKWVVSFHGHDVLRYLVQGKEYEYLLKDIKTCNTRKYQQLENLLKFSSSITSCSVWLSQKIKEVFPIIKDQVIIYNAVDTTSYENIPAQKEYKPYLFAFGRLDPCKGFKMLIRAYSTLKKQENTDLPILIIAGEGIERKNLEIIIESEQLKNIVFLPGRLDKNEIIAYTKGALINLVPSLREPFGIVLLEALASLKPVLSSNRGGLPEAGGNLVTYFEPNIEDCVNQLKAFLCTKHVFIKRPEIIHEHLEKFTIEKMIATYEKTYYSL